MGPDGGSQQEGLTMEFALKNFEKEVEITGISNIMYCEMDRQYGTGKTRPRHRELVYVDNGRLEIQAEKYNGPLEKNHVLIHQVGESHVLSCAPGESANVIVIGFFCESGLLDQFALTPSKLTVTMRQLLAETVREGRSALCSSSFGAEQMIKLKLETFLIELLRQAGEEISIRESAVQGDSEGVREVCRYIKDNYKEKITLNDLCFLFNTNKTSLCSRFKDAYGTTVIGYINDLRLKEAKRLLREGKLNLTEIADRVGFSSIHYFSKIFKQHEKETPSDYIKNIREKKK